MSFLKQAEGLLDVGGGDDLRLDLEDVEADGLGERAALADGDDVAVLQRDKRGRAVGRGVAVALLETVVLAHVVEVVAADDDRPLHLCGHADTTHNTAGVVK